MKCITAIVTVNYFSKEILAALLSIEAGVTLCHLSLMVITCMGIPQMCMGIPFINGNHMHGNTSDVRDIKNDKNTL